jgi:hypothetical protein
MMRHHAIYRIVPIVEGSGDLLIEWSLLPTLVFDEPSKAGKIAG